MSAVQETTEQDGGSKPRVISQLAALQCDDRRQLLMAHALGWLMRVTPAALGLFYRVDGRLLKLSGEVMVARGRNAPQIEIEAMLEQYAELYRSFDPLSPRRLATDSRSVIDLDEVVPAGLQTESPYRRLFLRPHGVLGQTTMLIRVDGRITAGVDLLRSDRDAHPGPAGLALLRASHGLLQQAYGLAEQPLSLAPSGGGSPADLLTRREWDVARLVAGGASNREAASALGISEATVKSHLLRAFEKLRVRSRSQLALTLRNGPVAGEWVVLDGKAEQAF